MCKSLFRFDPSCLSSVACYAPSLALSSQILEITWINPYWASLGWVSLALPVFR